MSWTASLPLRRGRLARSRPTAGEPQSAAITNVTRVDSSRDSVPENGTITTAAIR